MKILTTLVVGIVAVVAVAGPVRADAASRALPEVSAGDVMPYLQQLQTIADRNGGNRAHGTRGYLESVEYVRDVLVRAGFRTQVQRFSSDGTGYNLIADWPGGNPDDTVVLGAHLDSVPEGPGINDNGSGSAAILATAVAVSKAKFRPAKHLRFAWWGAEEKGMVGSAAYLAQLPTPQVRQIDAYLNFDMTGINPANEVLVIDVENGLAKPFDDFYAQHNVGTFEIGVASSDHVSFDAYGIAVGGFTTGLDDCYHQACDRVENISPATEALSTNAIVHAVQEIAR